VGTLHRNTSHRNTRTIYIKGQKKTISIKDEKKWGQGRKLEARKNERETEKTKQKQENTKQHKPQREEGKPNQRGEKNKGQGNERGPGFGKRGVETLRTEYVWVLEQSCVQGGYILPPPLIPMDLRPRAAPGQKVDKHMAEGRNGRKRRK
jgi:hypothetical protein